MTLAAGDLTTLDRTKTWMGNITGTGSDRLLTQLIGSSTSIIYNKINRGRLFSQNYTRYFNGTGTNQLILPDYPVSSITSVQIGQVLVPPSPLPIAQQTYPIGANLGYGYRVITLGNGNNLDDDPSVIELNWGRFYCGNQNVKVVYTAGYLISDESHTVPASPGPYTLTVDQPNGIWCRTSTVTYSNGVPLMRVMTLTGPGQYINPVDTDPGLYVFDAGDTGVEVLISYSFIPADLEEACIQMVAERQSYTGRVGAISKSLGGQETMSWLRGGGRRGKFDLPPEVEASIQSYMSVLPPAIGAYV